MDRLKAIVKRALSYRKSVWSIDDYPIRILEQKAEANAPQGRRKLVPWIAQVINWGLSGHGDTREEALRNLEVAFKQFQATHDTLPRPGSGAPIEVASVTRIRQHDDLARDFMSRVLNLNFGQCFISDESSLWDFHEEETNEDYYRKIALLYNVDVSSVEDANLVQIFETIAKVREAGEPASRQTHAE